MDITAVGSTGHVLAETGWDTLFPQFGESVYPSFDPVVIDGMKLAHDSPGGFTQQQADELKQRAAEYRAMWAGRRQRMGDSFKADMRRGGISNAEGRMRGGGDQLVREARRREAVFSWTTKNLGVGRAVAESNATGMLLTFNPGWPVSFSCNDTTASVSRGEAFPRSVYEEWNKGQGG